MLSIKPGYLRKAFIGYKTAQSIIEFVMLFTIVVAAIAVTHKYIYRSMNARLKQIQEELTYNVTRN